LTAHVTHPELDVPVGTPHKKHKEFSIPFEVPYKNATRDLTGITSSTRFSQFLVVAAAKMNVSTLHLTQVGYIPSYKPKNPKPIPKMLEDKESWEILLDDVSDYIEGCKSKNWGKGAVKPFTVLLTDMSIPDGINGKKVSAHYISFHDSCDDAEY
jgi:hypothetical protein